MSLDETLDCGEDTGTPVSEDYKVPFHFTGEIEQVTIRLKGTGTRRGSGARAVRVNA